MEPSPGRLPELEATRPHMEPKAACPAAAPLVERKFHVLVGVTGSVAALKLPLLVSKLLDIPGLEVAVVTTERAKHFYSPQDVPVTLYSDADEWEMWKCRSDPVLHIDLRRWADLLLVAPLDANTLGKVASGICDNLLVSDALVPLSLLGLAPSLLSCRLPCTWRPAAVGPRSAQGDCAPLFPASSPVLSPLQHMGTALVLLGQPDLPLLSRTILLAPAHGAQPGAHKPAPCSLLFVPPVGRLGCTLPLSSAKPHRLLLQF
ncbi:phosphopantothenoylcysteine decarboxylase isoform X1 [Saimiri boliviensis]|uniref:phosphopantothenoylcysteine decarboxylase isoform X1 n=1 Tax=Saimiri boliviensis TaxID=27679 RepID=UPI000533FAA3|nr:phosphopantothenoylcysteine decarboxylase isoform X1 [Saimiri boliviensis boliviensis]